MKNMNLLFIYARTIIVVKYYNILCIIKLYIISCINNIIRSHMLFNVKSNAYNNNRLKEESRRHE